MPGIITSLMMRSIGAGMFGEDLDGILAGIGFQHFIPFVAQCARAAKMRTGVSSSTSMHGGAAGEVGVGLVLGDAPVVANIRFVHLLRSV